MTARMTAAGLMAVIERYAVECERCGRVLADQVGGPAGERAACRSAQDREALVSLAVDQVFAELAAVTAERDALQLEADGHRDARDRLQGERDALRAMHADDRPIVRMLVTPETVLCLPNGGTITGAAMGELAAKVAEW